LSVEGSDSSACPPPAGSAPRGAVFLSYASQDAAAVERIAAALRAAGVEVWFDKNELTGGDAWDAKIRKQIKECTLFVPVISAATQARLEGYFRIEWKLAAQRTHAMAEAKTFLLPVVIDGTPDAEAHVPEEFRAVQWTRLTGADTMPVFARGVQTILNAGHPRPSPANAPQISGAATAARPPRRRFAVAMLAGVVGLALVAGIFWLRPAAPKPEASRPAAGNAPTVAASVAAPVENAEVRKLVQQGRAFLEAYVVDDTSREDLTLAEDHAKKALQLDVTDAGAWALSALVASSYVVTYRDVSPARRSALIAAAEKAIKLAPGSDEAQFARAAAFRMTDAASAEAERMLRELVQRAPTDKRFLRMLASVLRNRQANDAALELYDRAAALPGGDARALLSRAEMLLKAGRLDEAEAATDRSLAVQPTGAAALFKVSLARAQGDLAKARAELAKVPPAVLLDERGAAMAANLWLWSREPEKALAVLAAFPGDDFCNTFYFGPKSALIGFAHQIAGHTEAARFQWQSASKSLDRQQAADPWLASQPIFIAWRMLLNLLLNDTDHGQEASQMFRLYLQLGGPERIPVPAEWEPVHLLTLLGRQDILIDMAEIGLKNGDTSNLREDLRHNPLYDPLRSDPRFQALLVEPVK